MSLLPSIFDNEHPSNIWLKRIAPVSVPVLIALVVFMQQFLVSLSSTRLSSGLHSITSNEEVSDPGVAALTVNAKLLVKLRHLVLEEGATPDETTEVTDEDVADLDELDDLVTNRVDRVRVAMVAGELIGPQAALTRLDILATEVEAGGHLAGDIDWLQRWYKEKAASLDAPQSAVSSNAAVTQEAIDAIIDRHGWFAKLAFSWGKPASDPLRWEVISGGESFVVFSMWYLIGLAILGLAGLVLLIGWLVAAARHALDFEMDSPSAPSQVYYETFGIFCLVFIFGVMFSVAVLGETSPIALIVNQVLMWACASAVLWPRLRGVPRMEFTSDMGLNAGAGFGREILVGLAAFAVCIPFKFLLALIIGAIAGMFGSTEDPVGAPMYEEPLSNSWVLVVIAALGSVVWAPFVEECLFRGTLQTALRSRLGPAASILLSSVAFGAVHPYSIDGILNIVALGVMFGILREWRGSLIAPITLHALHNGAIMLSTLGTISLID